MYTIELYKTSSGNCPFEDYYVNLLKKNKMKDLKQINKLKILLEKHGIHINEYSSNASKLVDKRHRIYELRPGGNRVFYVYMEEQTILFLHAFAKKGQKIQKRQIDKAIIELNDYKQRQPN